MEFIMQNSESLFLLLQERMLQFNPDKRISVSQALASHPLFREMTEHTTESFSQAQFVKAIDMSYDFEYDNQPTDSKNMPVSILSLLMLINDS